MEDHLPISAAALEEKYENVKRGKEDLEAKLTKAVLVREKIAKLKSSKYCLSQKDLNQLAVEMSIETSIIEKSLIAESELIMLKERIAKIESSGVIASPIAKHQTRSRIDEIQKSIAKAAKVQEDILEAEQDSGFCSEAEIEKLQKDLASVLIVFEKLQPLDPGNQQSYHKNHIVGEVRLGLVGLAYDRKD